MSSSKILITRPRHDNPTHYLFAWTKKVIDEVEKKGFSVIDLAKEKATKKNVQSYLRKDIPWFVFLNGHGGPSVVTGHENEILISVDDGADLFKDKVVFMRACSAGKFLGPAIMENGSKGFVGYKEDFVFLHDKEFIGEPLNDKLATPFMECSNHVALSLLKGHNVADANKASKKIYRKTISEMLNSESANSFALPYLLANMSNQIHLVV